MDIVFRGGEGPQAAAHPGEGEVHLRPARAEHADRLDLAVLVLEHGPGSLVQGPGAPRLLVLPGAFPTLDDLLAASLIEAAVQGRELPQGMKKFALYAGMAREGLRPSNLPLENSIEGIYLTLCSDAGKDLDDPATTARLLEGWHRLERAIWDAAAAGVDPFTVPFLAEREEFARERAFLKQDREVYQQDVARGERWRVNLPGGPPRGAALVLNEPRSAMFKYWARSDTAAPGGAGYMFLAVNWGAGQWVFSTDPVQRLSLLELRERLQAAELAKSADAESDRWFDGARFRHSLIAAPIGGSRLADAVILRQVRRWARAKALGPRRAAVSEAVERATSRQALMAAGCVAALLLLVIGVQHARHTGRPGADLSRGLERVSPPPSVALGSREGKDHALLFAVDHYGNGWPTLTNPVADADALRHALADEYGFTCDLTPDADDEGIVRQLEQWQARKFADDEQLLIFFAGHGSYDPKLRSGYVVASNAVAPGAIVPTHCIAYDTLKKAIDAIPCKHILVVLDVCHGGTIGDLFRSGGGDIYGNATRDDILWRALGPASPQTRLYLSSVGNAPTSDGAEGGHSPFARRLLDALTGSGPPAGPDGSGVTSVYKVYALVQDVASRSGPQLGPFTTAHQTGGDFLFIRKAHQNEPEVARHNIVSPPTTQAAMMPH